MSESAFLLGIDTSAMEGSMALVRVSEDGSPTLLVQRALTGRNRSAELVPALRSMLAETNTALAAISAIVVVYGPGTFTGLRVGISAAKALSEAANIPLIAVSKLALLGIHAEEASVTVLDAGRGEFYVRQENGDESLELLSSLSALATGEQVRICEPLLANALERYNLLLVPPPTAFDAVRASLPRFFAGSFDEAAILDANYVRRPYSDAMHAASIVS
jgi:tRNA threonylcarbamoyladenosine biosynthesis protein TsaB